MATVLLPLLFCGRAAPAVPAMPSAPAASVPARPLRVCVLDEDYAPFSFPAREGPGQFLLRRAIERQGGALEITHVPWRRCIEGVRAGTYDAVLGAAANASFFSFLSFPERDGRADPRRSLGSLEFRVMQRRGEAPRWDGQRFSAVEGPVLYGAGIVIVRDALARQGVDASDNAKTSAQLMRMLVAHRADAIVVRQHEAQKLMREAEFQGRLDLLPQPLVAFDGYLAVRREWKEAYPPYVEAVWDEIGRLRAAPDWPATARVLLNDATTP
ncbi:MAG: hypothetical protein V4724_27220 [Pseudomonadota bacterium]